AGPAATALPRAVHAAPLRSLRLRRRLQQEHPSPPRTRRERRSASPLARTRDRGGAAGPRLASLSPPLRELRVERRERKRAQPPGALLRRAAAPARSGLACPPRVRLLERLQPRLHPVLAGALEHDPGAPRTASPPVAVRRRLLRADRALP